MVGLPEETDDDIEALIALTREVAGSFDRNVTVNVTPYVPKAHTPFERVAMASEDVLTARLARRREALGRGRISVRAEGAAGARLQAVLARGDRTVGEALLRMRRPSAGRFERSLRDLGASFADYTRAREPGEALPWDVVDSGVRPTYRRAEASRAAARIPTPDCTHRRLQYVVAPAPWRKAQHDPRRGQASIPYWRFEGFPAERVAHGVFTRVGGVKQQPPFATLNVGRTVGDDPARGGTRTSRASMRRWAFAPRRRRRASRCTAIGGGCGPG